MVTIRRAALADRVALFEFIEQAYSGRWQYKIPERWEWEFLHNPFLNDGEIPVFIALNEEGKVIGQSCSMMEKVKIGSGIFRVGWGVDNYVLPEYRNQGIASKLQKLNDESNEIFMSLSMAEAPRRIKTKLGAVSLEPVPLYRRYHKYTAEVINDTVVNRFIKSDNISKRWLSALLKFTYLDRLLRFLIEKRNILGDRKLNNYSDPSIELHQVDHFPEEINLLWDRLSPLFHAIIQRDYLHLNWKYVQQPHTNYVRFIARKNQEICGYLVLRKGEPPERRIGIIADLFADPQDAGLIKTLFTTAIFYFWKEKVDEIITATTIPEYQQILSELRFYVTETEIPVMHANIQNESMQTLDGQGRWFFGKSDHDWDQYPLAR